MKSADKFKLHQQSIAELTQKKHQLQLELVQKKAELKLNKLPNVKTVNNLRRHLAVINTIITQKQLQIHSQATQ